MKHVRLCPAGGTVRRIFVDHLRMLADLGDTEHVTWLELS